MKGEWIMITSIDSMGTSLLYKFDTPSSASASLHTMDIVATALTILILSANAAPKELEGQMKSLRGRNIRIIGAHVSNLFSFFKHILFWFIRRRNRLHSCSSKILTIQLSSNTLVPLSIFWIYWLTVCSLRESKVSLIASWYFIKRYEMIFLWNFVHAREDIQSTK